MACVVIPVFNEEKHIGFVLDDLKKTSCVNEIIVVDDGSTDKTSEVVLKYMKKSKRIKLIRTAHVGKGNACRIGAVRAKSNVLVFMDGDGQHIGAEIPKLLNALKRCDLALGQRVGAIPVHRKLSNWLSSVAVERRTGKWFPDVLTGFRAIRKKHFKDLGLKEDGYEIETEMIMKCVEKGYDVLSVLVKVRYNTGSRMPVAKSLKLGLHLINRILKR